MPASRQNIATLLRAEFAAEVAAGFPRLKRIPQTDIIWFLDYLAGRSEAEREALLDAVAESGATAFMPSWTPKLNERGTVDVPAGLAPMVEARSRPGALGGTRYTDLKMLCANPFMREPGGYHSSWRENLTDRHFQPRSDLLPDLDQMKPAKAPLLRKLVTAALTKSLGLKNEKRPGGVTKFMGRCGDCDVTIWADFGGMLSQLGYSASFKTPDGQPLAVLISYERLWATSGRWDYVTEENAPRSIEFFAEQIVYLADLTQRLVGAGGSTGLGNS